MTAMQVDKFLRARFVCDCVDSEITALKVVFEILTEFHFIWVSRIGILPFNAIRRDLDHLEARIF